MINLISRVKVVHLLVILQIVTLLLCAYFFNDNRKKGREIQRQTTNFAQLQEDHIKHITITKKEFEILNTTFKRKLDQVIHANDLKLRQIRTSTIINTVFRDTGSIKIVYRDAIKINDSSYKIPLSIDKSCWQLKGNILSGDQKSTFEVEEMTSTNSIQLIVSEKRRWLFWKKQTFYAFSDCGNVDIVKIDFVK